MEESDNGVVMEEVFVWMRSIPLDRTAPGDNNEIKTSYTGILIIGAAAGFEKGNI